MISSGWLRTAVFAWRGAGPTTRRATPYRYSSLPDLVRTESTLPKIGITSSERFERDGSVAHELAPYVRAVVRAGGEPVLLINDEANVDELVSTLDGVVLTGGVDVDPQRYGGKPEHSHAATGKYRGDRDAFEIALVRATHELGVPTLGICRGLQVANVAFGGTLIEDVRDELGERYVINHRQTYENGQDRAEYAPGHKVTVDAGSGFAKLAGTTSFAANSMHHQAVRTLASEFARVAWTSDGVVEALEAKSEHPFFYAVQWHPEELTPDSVSERLFNGLTHAPRKRRAR